MSAGRLYALALASGLATCLTLAAQAAQAADLRIATWNLGWHMDNALAQKWLTACGQKFHQAGPEQRWAPMPAGAAGSDGAPTGWQLRWGRDAPIDWDIGTLPPCDLFQADRQIVPATAESLANRQRQIRELLAREVDADIIAFQEVSGAQSVREVLPNGGADHEVCSYEGHKVQRLAIAWRKTLGTSVQCAAYWPLSLPMLPAKEQPRPGLTLTLKVDGKLLRVLTMHLKSSCVSPLEDTQPDGRGQLAGANPHCQVLHAQVPALEAWLEAESAGADGLVMLGDFNRDLAHEAGQPATAPVRSAGKPADPHTPGLKIFNLWREVNDGVPASSQLQLLATTCPAASGVQGLCQAAKQRRLSRDEYNQVGHSSALGCRNPLGLDHVAVSSAFSASAVSKVALGLRGRTSVASASHPSALLALSDHCPLVAELRW